MQAIWSNFLLLEKLLFQTYVFLGLGKCLYLSTKTALYKKVVILWIF